MRTLPYSPQVKFLSQLKCVSQLKLKSGLCVCVQTVVLLPPGLFDEYKFQKNMIHVK